MDICAILQATQQTDGDARKGAEKKLDEASETAPNELAIALLGVLVNASHPEGLKQEAAIILRQLVEGMGARSSVWGKFNQETQSALTTQVIAVMEQERAQLVRKSAGTVAVAIAKKMCTQADEEEEENDVDIEDAQFNYLMQHWPALLPWLSQAIASGPNAEIRCIASEVLKDLIPRVGEALLKKNAAQFLSMLSGLMADSTPVIRSCGAKLVLAVIENCDLEVEDENQKHPIFEALPAVTKVLQDLADPSTEAELLATLQAFVEAAEQEGDFIFSHQGFPDMWKTLMTITNADKSVFANDDIRQTAMEAVMTLFEQNVEDFEEYYRSLIEANFRYLQEVEEDVNTWTLEGKDTDEDECDEDVVEIGEQNFDRLSEKIAELPDKDSEVFMPLLFQYIQCELQKPECTWKQIRAALVAISSSIEYVQEDEWVDQCFDFLIFHCANEHPRVKHAAFSAIGQASYDHQDRVEDKYTDQLIPVLLKGMRDENIRVATGAVCGFSAAGEHMDEDELAPFMEEILTVLFQRLEGGSNVLQGYCLDGIAAVAEGAEEEIFKPYYDKVMPPLKQLLGIVGREGAASSRRKICGKTLGCITTIGEVVGKDIFANDAKEVMDTMVGVFQAGFGAEDVFREAALEGAGDIAKIMGKDFKPYVTPLLPCILDVLKTKPQIMEEQDDLDADDVSLEVIDGKLIGLKTSVIEEFGKLLEMLSDLMKALEDDFSEFMAPTCQVLIPMLSYPLSEDLKSTLFETFGCCVCNARAAAEKSKFDPNCLRELVTEFLKKVMGDIAAMEKITDDDKFDCVKMQALAKGAADVLEKAGEGVLGKDAVRDTAIVAGKVLAMVEVTQDVKDAPKKKKDLCDMISDDDDSEDGAASATAQSVRFALVDIILTLMKQNRADFVELVLPTLVTLVGNYVPEGKSGADRSLGFYIAEKLIQGLGEASVQFWNAFMNHALVCLKDDAAVVQQHAAKLVGCAAGYSASAVMATAAAGSLYDVLQKNIEKYRRRRVKSEQKPTALALEACIQALGNICEFHETQLGAHAPQAWNMWIKSMPLKYDVDASKQVHAQLLRLVAKEHPVFMDANQLPKVLQILLEVYKTKYSTKELNNDIKTAFERMGQEKIVMLCSGFKDTHKAKLEQMRIGDLGMGGA